MKIRTAGLLDLARIEEMHRSSDIRLSEAAPPAARLWSLFSSTLSALLPLSQETLMYVAEENGKVLGYIQASGQPLGLDLRRARVLQVLNLQVADEADSDEVAPALVTHLCNQALERGALRLFVRLPDRDALLPAFRLQGFRQYATEQVVYSEEPKRRGDQYPQGLRPAKRGDDRRLYQLYRKVTPQGVSQLEAPTYREWRALHAGELSGGEVVDRIEVVGWVRMQRGTGARPDTLKFMALPENPLPAELARALHERTDPRELLEIVLDLGREPEARVPGREVLLADHPVSASDLDHVANNVGQFGDDNRAGIERTLHRVSAIRNRSGRIVGLTMRVGRAVTGTGEIIRDIVVSGQSILLLGRPGIGKTTMLRECARLLADELRKRVVIVDTSNEIGGDGDIPHPGIGRARRMQVKTPLLQHAVMIEAVENHMPEVIVIDEIGTELEAAAARTIAERGVQLIATAHGQTLENLLVNPTLNDLLGGIQSVTLSDEEARRRGTQKSVLERKAPPTFDVLVEIQDRDRVAIHQPLADVVDQALRGTLPTPRIRVRTREGRLITNESDGLVPALLPGALTPASRRRKPGAVFPY